MKTLYPKQSLVIIICLMLSVTLLFAGNKSTFNVKDFGAVGNGTTLDSPSFNKAIEVCCQKLEGSIRFGLLSFENLFWNRKGIYDG